MVSLGHEGAPSAASLLPFSAGLLHSLHRCSSASDARVWTHFRPCSLQVIVTLLPVDDS